jgi:hypothetical protein
MKKYKVYIQAYHEVIIEAESPDQARMEVCENLSDYFMDDDCMLRDCVVGDAQEVKE